MTQTPNLGLPLLAAAQSQKHVTHNEALALLDGAVQLAVASRGLAAPPATLVEGVRWIVPAAATGAFAGQADRVALVQAGALAFLEPRAGWLAWVADEALFLVFDGADWRIPPGMLSDNALTLDTLAVGTAIDAGNPLSVKANDLLFAARTAAEGGTGDLRYKLNKEAAAGTASQLYQTGFSGRAETGLCGDDHFRVKVSADGATWRDAIDIDPGSGALVLPSAGLAANGACLPLADNAFSCGAGGARWSAIWSATGTIQTSDARQKTDVAPCDLGLEFLRRLNPVSWRWIEGGRERAGPRPGRRRHYGLIAQDVRATLDALGAGDFAGHVRAETDDPASTQGLRYDQFIAPLVRAVQELDRRLGRIEAEGGEGGR